MNLVDPHAEGRLAARADPPLLPAVVDALPIPIAAAARDGAILAVNPAWDRLARSARPGAEPLGQGNLAALFPDAAGAAEAVARAARPVTRQALRLAADPSGMVTWWDLDLVPHPERPGCVLVTARDMTEQILARREAEDARDALEPVDVRLRLAQEAAGIGTWEWDAEADRQAWSAQQFRLHGLDPAVDVPPSLSEWLAMVHPDDRGAITDAVETGFSRAFETGYQMEFRIIRRDTGAERWMLSFGRVLARAPDGRIARVVGVNLDVTAHRQEQAASEAQFRKLADMVPHMIYAASPAGLSDYRNQRWFDYTGQTAEQAGGDGWTAQLHPDDRDGTIAAWARAVATGQPYENEHRIRGRDGEYRWFLSRAVPLRNETDGRILRWIGSTTDVGAMVAARDTAARAAQALEARVAERGRALTEAAVELQAEMRRRQDIQSALLHSQKLEALGQLTAGVAHDFNNVLAAIQGSFELIEERTRIPRVRQLVDIGKQATETAAALTRQLLDFGRATPLKPDVLAVDEVVRRANALIRHAVGGPIVHDLDVAPGLWPVLADARQIEIALLNLAINARDAMPAGGTLIVAARNLPPEQQPPALPAGDYVAISVSDTGQGMPPDVLARATEPFFTTKPEGQGTGLGLAMVHSFALRSGGCVQIDSRVDQGTTVRIVLPRAQVAIAAAPSRTAGAARPARTLLLVDDDEQVRQIAADILRDQGHIVIEAPNAEAAIVLSHSFERLDMLVTDLTLPGAGGATLAARLRTERPDLPVLFMTGLGGRDDLSGESVLSKPFTPIALSRAVARRIGGGPEVAAPEDGLARRLRNPALLAAYLFWRAASHGDRPPRLPDLDWNGQPDAEHSFVVAVEPEGDGVRFRFLRVGRALRARLTRSIEETSIVADATVAPEDEVLGSLAAAYRRCARTFSPSYEYASYDFGDGAPILFERLILPVADDGERVTHLVGIALFSGAL